MLPGVLQISQNHADLTVLYIHGYPDQHRFELCSDSLLSGTDRKWGRWSGSCNSIDRGVYHDRPVESHAERNSQRVSAKRVGEEHWRGSLYVGISLVHGRVKALMASAGSDFYGSIRGLTVCHEGF